MTQSPKVYYQITLPNCRSYRKLSAFSQPLPLKTLVFVIVEYSVYCTGWFLVDGYDAQVTCAEGQDQKEELIMLLIPKCGHGFIGDTQDGSCDADFEEQINADGWKPTP